MPEIFASLSSSTIGLLGVEPARELGLRSWIEVGAYIPAIRTETGELELRNVTTSEMVPFLSFDYDRFALASAESFLVAKAEWASHNLVGWPLLKLYYSAFFAAHAIMRSQGAGVLKIEKPQAKKLNNFISLMNSENASVAPGMYRHQFLRGTFGDATMRLTKHGEGQGVHESFWKTFCDFLNIRAEHEVVTNSVDANAFLSGVAEITAAISGSQSHIGSWLSNTRNEINYQHKYSVWFPVKRNKNVNEILTRLKISSSNSIPLDLNTNKEPITSFIEICSYLALLSFEISEYVAARSRKGGAFGQKWRRLRATIV